MNLRQYKKKAKRARDILVAEFGCKASDFWYPPKAKAGEYDLHTSENVKCKDRFGNIPHLRGTPVYLPEITDYWGEANEPHCCIDLEREVRWWEVCGDSFIRKELAAEAAQ